MNLRIPGPTPLPPEVQESLARQMIGHRSKACANIVAEITPSLKEMFGTAADMFILTSSGTGAMEAAVANFLSPGDEVLVVAVGKFGERFGKIARVYGANVTQLDFPYGQAADPQTIAEALEANPQYKAVFVTHNETSTGVTNDLPAIGEIVDQYPALLIVDSISAASALPLEMDRWGLDVVVSGSQKGWMIPPGLAFIAVNDRAWAAHARSSMPRFYFDLSAARKSAAKNQTPYTPAVGLLFGLQEALRLMRKEGFDQVIERHRRIGEYTREGVKSLGMRLFADEAHASNTVTAVLPPEGVNAEDLREFGINYVFISHVDLDRADVSSASVTWGGCLKKTLTMCSRPSQRLCDREQGVETRITYHRYNVQRSKEVPDENHDRRTPCTGRGRIAQATSCRRGTVGYRGPGLRTNAGGIAPEYRRLRRPDRA